MGEFFHVLVILGRLACLRPVSQMPVLLNSRRLLDVAQHGQFGFTAFVLLVLLGHWASSVSQAVRLEVLQQSPPAIQTSTAFFRVCGRWFVGRSQRSSC